MDNIFLPPKKMWKKKIAAARLATILATRWTGNRLVYGQPNVVYLCRYRYNQDMQPVPSLNIVWHIFTDSILGINQNKNHKKIYNSILPSV